MPASKIEPVPLIASGSKSDVKLGSTPRESTDSHTGPDLVRERLRSIEALAAAGHNAEAREASADLLFDFQPLIAAHLDLVSLCEDVLLSCGATALWRRFVLAVHGHAATPPIRRTDAGSLSSRASVRRASVQRTNWALDAQSLAPESLNGLATQDV
jgi:hypothetical protein